ncbi:hypothetical protein AB5I41_27015 [Sphingomonas sp. MMS24-JH45]
MLRVVTLSTLFPDATRPNFGVFVERQTLGLAAHSDVESMVVAPVGLDPGPCRGSPLTTIAPRFPARAMEGARRPPPALPRAAGDEGTLHARALAHAATRVLDPLAGSFDVIDASFFFPDGVAAVALGRRYGVPVSIKARGHDVHFWGENPATRRQPGAARRAAERAARGQRGDARRHDRARHARGAHPHPPHRRGPVPLRAGRSRRHQIGAGRGGTAGRLARCADPAQGA